MFVKQLLDQGYWLLKQPWTFSVSIIWGSMAKCSECWPWDPEAPIWNPLWPLANLRKQPTFGNATTGFPAKWCERNEGRNSILMMCHYPDPGSASDWSCRVGNLIQPIRSTTQIWVVMRHQYEISAHVSHMSFGGETVSGITKCQQFSQGNHLLDCSW